MCIYAKFFRFQTFFSLKTNFLGKSVLGMSVPGGLKAIYLATLRWVPIVSMHTLCWRWIFFKWGSKKWKWWKEFFKITSVRCKKTPKSASGSRSIMIFLRNVCWREALAPVKPANSETPRLHNWKSFNKWTKKGKNAKQLSSNKKFKRKELTTKSLKIFFWEK